MDRSVKLALCNTTSTGFLSLCKVELAGGKTPPEWVQLIPGGSEITARDGRKFKNPDPNKVVELFSQNGIDLPIDYEHATELKAPKGESAPAAGWITAMEVREGGSIWGKIDWTDLGNKSVTAREYRFISPGFYHDKEGKIVGLSSAGLTNKPALKLAELAREHGDVNMDKELLKLLGLAEDATAEQISAKVKALCSAQTEVTTLKTKVDELSKKVGETETQLATARSQVPGLDKFVPRTDYDMALARVKKLEDDNASSAKKTHDDLVASEVDAAVKAGKITPATKDFYIATCATAEGLVKFRDFVKAAPVIAPDNIVSGGTPPNTDKKALTAEERKFISVMQLTEEQYRAGAEA